MMDRTIDGKFTLLGRKEAGKGFSCHLAHHHRLGTQVLLDLLKPEELFDGAARRCEPEMDDLAALLDRLVCTRHPALQAVFAWGMEGEDLYVVREFIHGHSLDELLEETGALPPGQVREMVRAIVSGMGCLHGRGVHYLGINPRQVHVDRRGRARIQRPGYARLLERADPLLSRVTSLYLAPEVLRGERGTRSSDVYSLGVMVSQLLADMRDNRALDRVLREAVSESPGERPPSARVFLERLEEALKGRGIGGPASGIALPMRSKESVTVETCEQEKPEFNEGGSFSDPKAEEEVLRASPRERSLLNDDVSRGLRKLAAKAALSIPENREWVPGRGRARLVIFLAACATAAVLFSLWSISRGDRVESPDPYSSNGGGAGGVFACEERRVPTLSVPDLRGLDGDVALRLLRGMGVEVEILREPSRTVPRGKVIIQEPLQGENLRPDTRMRLFVSEGPLEGGSGGGTEQPPDRSLEEEEGGLMKAPSQGKDGRSGSGTSLFLPARFHCLDSAAGNLIADVWSGRSKAEVKPDRRGSPGGGGFAT